MGGTGSKKEVNAMKNYDGGRLFTILSSGDVSIGRKFQKRRTWNGSGMSNQPLYLSDLDLEG